MNELMLLEGLHIPLTTPFHPDGRLNLHKLASNVARYSKTPAAGLILLGPSGEPTMLTDDETREVLRTAAQSAAPEKVLIAGISRDSVHATLALADFAAQQSYDAALVGVPSVFFVDTHTRELLTYFRTIADRSPLPILLLSTDSSPIPVDATVELSSHPNILSLLTAESTAANVASIVARTSRIRREVTVTPTFAPVTLRMEIAAAASYAPPVLISVGSLTGGAPSVADPLTTSAPLRTRTKMVGFQVVGTRSSGLLADLRAGVVGIAPVFSACAPQACYEVFAAWKDDDQALADEKQARLLQVAALTEESPAVLKFACDLNGYFGGLPRMPHLPPTVAQRAALELLMKSVRN